MSRTVVTKAKHACYAAKNANTNQPLRLSRAYSLKLCQYNSSLLVEALFESTINIACAFLAGSPTKAEKQLLTRKHSACSTSTSERTSCLCANRIKPTVNRCFIGNYTYTLLKPNVPLMSTNGAFEIYGAVPTSSVCKLASAANFA